MRLLEDLARELIPGAAARGCHVVDAELDPLDQADDAVSEVPSVGRRADLVADDEDLAMVGGEAEHRLDEVGAAGAEQPGGADDEVALVGGAGRLLPGQLAAPVCRERRGLVGFDVGRALAAVEDIVAADVDDRGADQGGGRGDVARPLAVDPRRLLLGLLGAVDVGPGGAIDDDVGTLALDLGADRRPVGDVELGVAIADHLVAGVARSEHHVATQHPGGAGYEQLHDVFGICGRGLHEADRLVARRGRSRLRLRQRRTRARTGP